MSTESERAIRQIQRYGKSNPDAVRLARLASLAVRVEPYLLRRLRLELLSEADVGIEADLWFSPLVESRGPGFFVLSHHVVEVLRKDLAADRVLFETVWKITEESHQNAAPSIRLEERLNALALSNESDLAAAINEALQPALRALRKGGGRAVEIAHWALRALPRFDPGVRQCESAIALLLSAQLLLGSKILKETPDTGIKIPDIAWVLPKEALAVRIPLGVELIERGIRFFEASPDSPAIDLPSTTPLLVGLNWQHHGERFEMLVEAQPGRTFDLEADVASVTIITLAGDQFSLKSVEAWAGEVGYADQKKNCFVIQGFGEKTDFRTGRKLDLDASYEVIKRAVEDAGLRCIRADEVQRSQVIDKPVFEMLLNADLVIADLSTSNINAAYQLGVRHALRPRSTIIVVEDKWESFFDVSHNTFLTYEHLGEGISDKEAERFSGELTEKINYSLDNADVVDSPVYVYLEGPWTSGVSRQLQSGIETGTEFKSTCFVIQGFGEKTDFRTGRKLDLDASYEVIKEAVENAGLRCIRADEVQHSQVIDRTMFEMLLNAELVIADLSTSNLNAAYELGVRHGLRPRSTIIVVEDKSDFAFDLSSGAVMTYVHQGIDLGYREAKRFSQELTEAVKSKLSGDYIVDSPLYLEFPELAPPVFHAPEKGGIPEAPVSEAIDESEAHDAGFGKGVPLKVLTDQGRDAMQKDDFNTAKAMYKAALDIRPNDESILQKLALATYKSKMPSEKEALQQAYDLIDQRLDPHSTRDPETIGLWAVINKRLWQQTQDAMHLEYSINALDRGFAIQNDYYNGINLAYMLNVRGALKDRAPSEAKADYLQANHVRLKVIEICNGALNAGIENDEEKYWVLATLWEAYVGLGDPEQAARWEAEATHHAENNKLPAWMVSTTRYQIKQLSALLGSSPVDAGAQLD